MQAPLSLLTHRFSVMQEAMTCSLASLSLAPLTHSLPLDASACEWRSPPAAQPLSHSSLSPQVAADVQMYGAPCYTRQLTLTLVCTPLTLLEELSKQEYEDAHSAVGGSSAAPGEKSIVFVRNLDENRITPERLRALTMTTEMC